MNIAILLATLVTIQTGNIQNIVYTRATAHETIYAFEVAYAIPNDELYKTLKCESGLDPHAENLEDAHGGSFGISQINASHTNITKAEMFDAIWSIDWSAKEFAAHREHMWSCYSLIKR